MKKEKLIRVTFVLVLAMWVLSIVVPVVVVSVVVVTHQLSSIRKDKQEKKEVATNKILVLMEKAYYEGQKDYAEGDTRVKLDSDSCYVWVKSPWDSGTPAKFNPKER